MLNLFNTLTRKKKEFKPLQASHVGLYTCGPTVYNYAHIGNLRTYIFEDVLKRVLLLNSFKVKHVMNITDVGHLTSDADEGEDKMEKGAQREKKTVWEIAEAYTQAFKKDLKDLNIIEPDIWCKATDHVNEQIELIKILEKKGFTYLIDDGMYFDTSKDPQYGKLARLDIKGLRAGARVEVVEGKQNPTDFALWKLSNPKGAHPEPAEGSSKKRQMEWPSPWGIGFPGWHIECSAMAMKYLGDTFDIHCGGIDHIPVHHTNEIAQSESATGHEFAKIWMHGEFLLINEDRMGKSAGNFYTLQSLIDKGYNPLSFRYFTYSAHYRQKLNFSVDALNAAQTAYRKLKTLAASWDDEVLRSPLFQSNNDYVNKFTESINDDLNMPQALAVVWDLAKSDAPAYIKKENIKKFDEVLGLKIFNSGQASAPVIPEEVQGLVELREKARYEKQWERADNLRKEIGEKGFLVKDTPQGAQLIKG